VTLRAEKGVVVLVLLVLLGGGFFFLAAYASGRAAVPPAWFLTRLDDAMPLLPGSVWIYLSWYPASAAVIFADRDGFRRAYTAYVIAFAQCVLGYVAFPIVIGRPLVPPQLGIDGAALGVLYSVDPPTNLCPSFHAAIATILVRVVSHKRLARVAHVWFIALCGACLLTRQHYVLDVVGGVAVGLVAIKSGDAFLAWRRRPACASQPPVCNGRHRAQCGAAP